MKIEEKTVSAKKLPPLFKKKYSQKKYEVLLKKIYIEADKNLVASIFEDSTDKKGRLVKSVDKSKMLAKSQVVRLKTIAKQIKKQKFVIKFVPLFAVLAFAAVLVVSVMMFKNVAVSHVIKSSLQGIFGAKTDIQSVNVQFLKSRVTVRGLAQASKDDCMKNLFEVDSITVDYEFSDLLKKKFHTKEFSVEGVALGTDRQKSGELKVKPKKSKKEKQSEQKIQKDRQEFGQKAAQQLVAMFENYNPENMLASLESELQSPSVAEKITGEVQNTVDKWKPVPEQYTESVSKFSDSVNSIINTNWSGISDPVQLKNAIEVISKALTEGNNLKTQIEKTSSDLKTDVAMVDSCSKELAQAMQNDSSLVEKKVNEMKALFTPSGLKSMTNDALESMLYGICGKYYPYAVKVKDLAFNAIENSKKNSKETKKEKKAKKEGNKRLAGRNVYYRANTVPSLFIEKISASGYENGSDSLLFSARALNIANDQNVTGKPTELYANFKAGATSNSAEMLFDVRPEAKNVVNVTYGGKNFPMEADAQIFNLCAKSDVVCRALYSKDGVFTIEGTLDMKNASLQGMDFEPARVCSIYKNALAGINKLTAGFKADIESDGTMKVELTNLDTVSLQIVTPLTAALTKELNSIANDATKNIMASLSEKTGGATDLIAQFTGINGSLTSQNEKVAELNRLLEAKKAEITRQLSGSAGSAITNALQGAGVSGDAANAASSAMKGLFNRR